MPILLFTRIKKHYLTDWQGKWIIDNKCSILIDTESPGNVTFKECPHQSHFSSFLAQVALYYVIGVEKSETTIFSDGVRHARKGNETCSRHKSADRVTF